MREKLEPVRPTTTGRYRSVVEMVRDLSDDDQFAEQFGRDVGSRELTRQLAAARSAKALSLRDVAEALGCSLRHVETIESGTDAELTPGDAQNYARVVGVELRVELASPPGDATPAPATETPDVSQNRGGSLRTSSLAVSRLSSVPASVQ